jgi:DNA-binding IclR family transcriptional regulator
VIHHRAVDRVTGLLELLADRPDGLTLSELAEALSAPLSSVKDLVHGLCATGYAERSGARYYLGAAPYILTMRTNQTPARMVSHHDLEVLATESGFTVLLGVRVGDDLVFIDEAGDHPALQYLAHTRVRHHLLFGTAGKALVAAFDDDEMHTFLKRQGRQDLVNEFLAEVQEIRATGVAIGISSGIAPRPGYPGSETGVVATAIRDHAQRVVGTVVIGHDPEFFHEHLGRMIESIHRHSAHWSTRRHLSDAVPPAAPEEPVTLETVRVMPFPGVELKDDCVTPLETP